MTVLLRFRDLKERGIANSWAQLKRMIELYGFPPGRMLTPNVRTWDEEDEVNPWIESRPVDGGSPLRGAAKTRHARKAAATANTADPLET
jgi:hypothetical protein